MKKLLKFLLKFITRKIINKYSPCVVAVTGSVGKTSTKESIVSVLSSYFSVRGSAGNLNTEFGAPLVFFGWSNSIENSVVWIAVIIKGISLLLFKVKNYPEVIVVEVAADKPGDIEYLSGVVMPNISVVTAVGETPVHVEFYRNVQEVAKEKSKIVSALPKDKGVAILCFDDPFVLDMRKSANQYITFGFKEGADVRITELNNDISGVSFNILYKEKSFPIFISKCLGKPSAYSFAAAFATGVSLGIEPENISSKNIKPLPGRLSLIDGKKESMIIDGSYNAAPASVFSALDCLEDLPGKRKIAVLGDMLEIGSYSVREHRKAGKRASSFCDYIFSVGKFSEEVKIGAIEEGFNSERIFSFSQSEEVLPVLEEIISTGDLLLVKGSQGVRTEKIVLGVMYYPETAKEILVRQSNNWKQK